MKKKKIILLLIAVMMLFSSCSSVEKISTTDTASNNPTVIMFASDYQSEPQLSQPSENLRSILHTIKNDNRNPDMYVLCGDYTNDRILHDYQLSPEESITEIKNIIGKEFGEADTNNMLFVQGNHDAKTKSIANTGLHKYKDSLIYVLNTQDAYPWKQGSTLGCYDKVRTAANNMKKCFSELIKKGETKPVFIAGHVPLHFTARVSDLHSTGDNLYASLIFNVVNEAAKELDIIYLFGHNHSKGWDCYLGGSSVFKSVGEKILIPEYKSGDTHTESFTEETLNFTYLNAGYIGYYVNCSSDEIDRGIYKDYKAADNTLTSTVCEIYSDKIKIYRYDNNGIHPITAKGAANPYINDSSMISEAFYSKDKSSPKFIYR